MQPNYRPALELAQASLRDRDPSEVAALSGARLARIHTGLEFKLPILGREYRIPFPECVVLNAESGAEAGVSPTLVGLHYLSTADGTPPRGEWIPWRAIPGASVYESAFKRRSAELILRTFGNDPDALREASAAIGATAWTMGDLSFSFRALPRLPMACVMWLADEEQPPDVNLLFDAVAPNYLPTEDLAALGTMVATALMQARGGRR